MYGHGAPLRDFTYIDDVVDGIVAALSLTLSLSLTLTLSGLRPTRSTSSAPTRMESVRKTPTSTVKPSRSSHLVRVRVRVRVRVKVRVRVRRLDAWRTWG